jgi:hypothetical protein
VRQDSQGLFSSGDGAGFYNFIPSPQPLSKNRKLLCLVEEAQGSTAVGEHRTRRMATHLEDPHDAGLGVRAIQVLADVQELPERPNGALLILLRFHPRLWVATFPRRWFFCLRPHDCGMNIIKGQGLQQGQSFQAPEPLLRHPSLPRLLAAKHLRIEPLVPQGFLHAFPRQAVSWQRGGQQRLRDYLQFSQVGVLRKPQRPALSISQRCSPYNCGEDPPWTPEALKAGDGFTFRDIVDERKRGPFEAPSRVVRQRKHLSTGLARRLLGSQGALLVPSTGARCAAGYEHAP